MVMNPMVESKKTQKKQTQVDGTLPETKSSPLKIGLKCPNSGNFIFQPLIFRGKILVSGRVDGGKQTLLYTIYIYVC